MTIGRLELKQYHVDEMKAHGNPAVQKAGRFLAAVVERHARGDYDRAIDIQSIDDALQYLPRDYKYDFLYADFAPEGSKESK